MSAGQRHEATEGCEELVMANTENGVPRPADRRPTQTLRTDWGRPRR